MNISRYYINPYFIFNFILAIIYPLVRSLGLKAHQLQAKDTMGYQKEYSIITGICTIIILRYLRYFTSMQKFIYEVLFYIKCANMIMFYFVDIRLTFWYLFGCVAVWILFKIPNYSGSTNVIFISSEEMFKEKIFLKKDKNMKGDNYWFVVFYSNYSDNCIFVLLKIFILD